jgi:hypothetical protein
MVMTTRHLEILQHALGLDQYGKVRYFKDGREYYGFMPNRNYFCAGDDDEPDCRELVAMGLMAQHRTTEVFPDFNCSVTDAGKEAVRKESSTPPKLTRSQERYRKYLRVGDCFENFREYLRYLKQKKEGLL